MNTTASIPKDKIAKIEKFIADNHLCCSFSELVRSALRAYIDKIIAENYV